MIAREHGSDAASLAFEALTAARSTAADVLIVDTAGRLQNKTELMSELEKIVRVMKKVDAKPRERMSDAAVQAKTGKTWPEWFAVLDKAGAAKMTHKEIAAHLGLSVNAVLIAKSRVLAHLRKQAEGLIDFS